MNAGALFLIALAGQAKLHHRNSHPQQATTTSLSRDMTPQINPRLAKQTLLQGRDHKEHFLTGIKSIFERRRRKKEGERNRRDLGLDSWDRIALAEQRQDDGQRAKREWDSAKKEWVVVPDLSLERSISLCDMRQRVTEEDEDTEVDRVGEEASIHNSFYAAPTSVGSPAEIDHARGSISERADDDVTIRPSMLAVGQSGETLNPEQRPDITADDAAKPIQTSLPAIDNIAKPSRPSLVATKKHISLRRAAIWNAARISGKKGFDFWKFGSQRSFEARCGPNDGEEPLLASSKSKNKALPTNPSKSDLDGLSKLIGSIDAEK